MNAIVLIGRSLAKIRRCRRHPAILSVAGVPHLFQLGRVCQSCLPIARQIICEANPWQAVLNPCVVNWRYCIGLIEAANGDINLDGVWFSHKCQRSAAARTERAHSAGPPHLIRRSRNESEFAFAERCPRDERCAATPTAIRTVAMCNVVRHSGRLIAHRAAQTTAADDIWVHGCKEVSAGLNWLTGNSMDPELSRGSPNFLTEFPGISQKR